MEVKSFGTVSRIAEYSMLLAIILVVVGNYVDGLVFSGFQYHIVNISNSLVYRNLLSLMLVVIALYPVFGFRYKKLKLIVAPVLMMLLGIATARFFLVVVALNAGLDPYLHYKEMYGEDYAGHSLFFSAAGQLITALILGIYSLYCLSVAEFERKEIWLMSLSAMFSALSVVFWL